MTGTTAIGRFVWHALSTPSRARAHEFYARTVGWTQQAWEHDPSYSMLVAASGPLGAVIERHDASAHWVPYIAAIDVDTTVDAATQRGATVITPPTTVANAGRHAVLSDPQGAIFGIHASSGPSQPEVSARFGEFSWHELATTTEPEAAFAFYAALFGWNDMLHMDMGPMGTYLIFGHNGMQLGGMFDKGRLGQPGPAYWVGYVRVPNVESAIEHAKAAGGSLLNGPMDVPGGDRVAQLADPQGALFALHTVAVDVRAAAPKKAAKKAAKKKAAKRKTGKKKTAKKKPTTKTARARKKVGKKTPKKTPRKAAKKQRKKAAARASKEPASRAKRRKLKTRR